MCYSVNVVFSDQSFLIDYDLAAEEGTHYPTCYNTKFPERHSTAIPGYPRKKEHDIFALQVIISDWMNDLDLDIYRLYTQGKSLADIISHIIS